MSDNPLRDVVRHLQQILQRHPDDAASDGQLLARFLANRDEAAFAALVRRYGPMVLGVSRRILRHAQDAEDAFQATFLVLARKAGSLSNHQAVGAWLYRVAYRIALESKAISHRRRTREKQTDSLPDSCVMPVEVPDWRPHLDRELDLLPDIYRDVIVACDLEGRTRKEAARLLGLAEGTISSRLARGRRVLAKRLSRHGLVLTAGVLAAGKATTVPVALASSTTKLAVLVAVGELAALSASVSILMKGTLKTMLIAKLKLAVGAVMVVVALGASGLVYRATGQYQTYSESQKAYSESQKAGEKPASELDVLRKEIELLKLKLEVVQEKVRVQETEQKKMRAELDGSHNANVRSRAGQSLDVLSKSEADLRSMSKDEQEKRKAELKTLIERADWALRLSQKGYVPMSQAEADRARLLAERQRLDQIENRAVTLKLLAEAASILQQLRKTKDAEKQARLMDMLEKSLESLHKQLKPTENTGSN